ncbi:WS/DGAT/MGAT family O-acyltransferase [Kistimonas asteriae]|uniref:WS/DGAT/MGAT family O-acyltransferase n=1 Tax=Kistimonas asteriae TaxID=517724 RepID=UPI001BAB13D8|nr:wax ester/triacylglycerol synthase family O-acyltransferase [Kistimonas asteriae]
MVTTGHLSALDTLFLNLETDTTPMHVGCLAIYDPSTSAEGRFDFNVFLSNFERRMTQVPVMRQRHVSAPFGLDFPRWISDPNFDLSFHLQHIALPKPGSWKQLRELAARLHASPLDLSRPPWEIYVVEGVNGVEGFPVGCYAVITKIHHALADGVRGTQIMAALHDLSPKGSSVENRLAPVIVDRLPNRLEMLTRAALRLPGNLLGKTRTLGRQALPLMKELASALLTEEGRRQRAPKTRFNGKLSSHRVFDAVTFGLEDIKAMRTLVPGSTVNDVIVTVIAGALRRYLVRKGELPDVSLNAMVPVNMRPDPGLGARRDSADSYGNHVGVMCPQIHTDIEDPVRRLREVVRTTHTGKERLEQRNGLAVMESSQLLPTTLTHSLVRAAVHFNLADHLQPVFNTVITNVPGPQFPLYLAGSKMRAFYGAGACYDTVGLFHIVFSYSGSLSISFTSCQRMLPDPELYAACLRQSYNELKKLLS